MKKLSSLFYIFLVSLQFGYSGCVPHTSIPSVTVVPSPKVELTSTSTPPPTPFPSTALPTKSWAPAYPPKTRAKSQCLDVESTPIHSLDSNGVLVLENRASLEEGHNTPGTFLLDMRSGQLTEITRTAQNQVEHIVSPNRELMAYREVTFNTAGELTKAELVVSNASGEPLSTMSWEASWIEMPAWLDDQHLVINASGLNPEESAGEKPATLVVLDPFSGERQVLKADFPKTLNIRSTLSATLPFWEGWSGVIYDPNLTRAIYPRFIGDNEEMYTYAIWNPSNQQLIATLEDVFAVFSMDTTFPMPKWSPDGSRFVFQGHLLKADTLTIELYEVYRDGQVKQLTQLSSVAYVWDSSYSWSPDGRKIAIFLGPPLGAAFEKARVAILDTETLSIIDYCVAITFSGEGYGAAGPVWSPIWSPDGHQFVVTDWYEKDHRRVILVDIEKKVATQIAEDMEPVGWMVVR